MKPTNHTLVAYWMPLFQFRHPRVYELTNVIAEQNLMRQAMAEVG